MRYIFLIFIILIIKAGFSQKAMISGSVLDSNSKAFSPPAQISILNSTEGTSTNEKGLYRLIIPSEEDVTIRFSYVGYKPYIVTLNLDPGEIKKIDVVLKDDLQLDTISVYSREKDYDGIVRVKPREYENMPTTGDDLVIGIVKRLPGVFSNNELSSQYSVRGGNFDENLMYVNGIEVYRPILIRSGNQEGMPFVNGSLVESIKFSAGGFSSFYGDKMSSVLDIKYRKPNEFKGSANANLMGGGIHFEGISKNKKFTYIGGLRYKTNRFLLSSLDTEGDYQPTFFDFQSLLSYEFNKNWEVNLLFNVSRNNYKLIPQSRETNFGNIFEALRLKIYFDGQEIDEFNTAFGALSFKYSNDDINLIFTSSTFNTKEKETFDIMGQYWLQVLENDLGRENFGQVSYNKGVGTFLNHARNYLDAYVTYFQHRGNYKEKWFWGIKYRFDIINDKINEWQMIDSAGFNLPHPRDNIGNFDSTYNRPNNIELNEVVKSDNSNIKTNQISGYLQRMWKFRSKDSNTVYTVNAGIRANYWNQKDLLISPRINLGIQPAWDRDIMIRFAAGIYSQPPFYKEMRDIFGQINTDIKPQKSFQVLGGFDYLFTAWSRPFKFTTEAYYKYMWDLIPYEVNDVRIRYFAENSAIGYATGIDLRLHGEFVKDADSWISLSFMKTAEDILNDKYMQYYDEDGEIISQFNNNPIADSATIYPGYIPRPSDQRFSFNLFFQDYIPKYPSWKVHLNLVFATGLPYGPPTHKRYQQTNRISPYRRVDIGFSKQLIGVNTKIRSKSILKNIKSAWLGLEVFNLLEIRNTVSYIWVQDVSGNYVSVPNYLTPRRVNLKLSLKF